MIYGGLLGVNSQVMVDYFQVCCIYIHILLNIFSCGDVGHKESKHSRHAIEKYTPPLEQTAYVSDLNKDNFSLSLYFLF